VELPVCGNFLNGSCERSDTHVSQETDEVFVIYCRTCKSVNVFPKDRSEGAARYQNFLKHRHDMEQKRRIEESGRVYSFGGK
jgi:hypothetical protein